MATPLDQDLSRQLIANALGLTNNGLDCVFVAGDFEWRSDQDNRMTEFGLAKLDTRDLQGLDPGRDGINWIKKLSATHFWIADTVDLKPSETQSGYDRFKKPLYAADRFDFGNSTVIPLQDLKKNIQGCFNIVDDRDTTGRTYRQIVLVVQGWSNEKQEFERIDMDIGQIKTVHCVVDTQVIHSTIWSENPALPVAMVDWLGKRPEHMHNGANDAIYTLAWLILGALWREAFAAQQSGDWTLMNSVFPLMRSEGILATQALQDQIAETQGSRCTLCRRFGHTGPESPLCSGKAPVPIPPRPKTPPKDKDQNKGKDKLDTAEHGAEKQDDEKPGKKKRDKERKSKDPFENLSDNPWIATMERVELREDRPILTLRATTDILSAKSAADGSQAAQDLDSEAAGPEGDEFPPSAPAKDNGQAAQDLSLDNDGREQSPDMDSGDSLPPADGPVDDGFAPLCLDLETGESKYFDKSVWKRQTRWFVDLLLSPDSTLQPFGPPPPFQQSK
ncbi:hypothetical protein BDV96DRAFT_607098 [Lophiotrema nucula]|uniref:Gfd2/YDR514C-like C-terminal domain-containing protein n=1 Tax=Lophiotrema nucula TaxID=690887 RepID=A0A6A5YHW8_9PLEO|nr:hypothetical protein BDV96DRAFT_607098 [Lophiotrema nucula]